MNTYNIELTDGHISTVIAETPGKARYDLFRHLSDIWDMTFKDFLGMVVSCKKAWKFKVSDLFGCPNNFARVIKERGIDFAYQGMKIEVAGKMGTIVGGNDSMNLDVVFDGQHWTDNCHPWYETRYFDRKGNVVADYTKN